MAMMQERTLLFHAVPRDEMPEYMHAAYDKAEQIGDTVHFEALANAPHIFEWFNDSYERLFYSGRVGIRIKELIRLRLSRSHGCALCSTWNASDMLEAGYSTEAINSVGPWPQPIDTTLFTEEEVATLRYTDQMVLQNMDGKLDADLYEELRKFYDDGQLMELGYLMVFLTGMGKFVGIADLTPKLESCPIPGNAGVDSGLKIMPARRLTAV